MPGWMQVMARVNPLTYAISAMRIMIIDGWEREAALALAVLAIASVVCLVLGTRQFQLQTGDRVGE